jgi:NAD(P)-dependent dehydrogenase (short-subunit alcohol dehydrogenase family)
LTDETYSLRGRTALITGGNRGIGFALAQALVGQGCHVVIAGRDEERLKAAQSTLSSSAEAEVTALSCDLCDPQSVEEIFAVVQGRYPTVDILVNNAGLAHLPSPVVQFSIETWKQVVDTDLTGMFLCTRACLPLMPPGGTIVNVLSIASVQAFPGNSAYHASKWGALGFTNSLREELRGRGIRVVGLLPGAVDTEMWDQYGAGVPRDKMLTTSTLAETFLHVVTRPPACTIEEIRIGPVLGLGIFAPVASSKQEPKKA